MNDVYHVHLMIKVIKNLSCRYLEDSQPSKRSRCKISVVCSDELYIFLVSCLPWVKVLERTKSVSRIQRGHQSAAKEQDIRDNKIHSLSSRYLRPPDGTFVDGVLREYEITDQCNESNDIRAAASPCFL